MTDEEEKDNYVEDDNEDEEDSNEELLKDKKIIYAYYILETEDIDHYLQVELSSNEEFGKYFINKFYNDFISGENYPSTILQYEKKKVLPSLRKRIQTNTHVFKNGIKIRVLKSHEPFSPEIQTGTFKVPPTYNTRNQTNKTFNEYTIVFFENIIRDLHPLCEAQINFFTQIQPQPILVTTTNNLNEYHLGVSYLILAFMSMDKLHDTDVSRIKKDETGITVDSWNNLIINQFTCVINMLSFATAKFENYPKLLKMTNQLFIYFKSLLLNANKNNSVKITKHKLYEKCIK